MSDPVYNPSAKNLLQSIHQRKYSNFKPYIQDIENQQQKAEKAVSTALSELLVNKKYKDVNLMLGGLILYKYVLLGATMDYIVIEDVFPPTIHQQISMICQFEGTEKDFQLRGNAYFKQVVGMQLTKETEKERYHFIVLACQLLKSMAKWYPVEYDDKEAQSIFKLYYERLVNKGVIFPQEKKFMFVKKTDEDLFRRNYQRFMEYQQNGQEKGDAKTPEQKAQPVLIEKKTVKEVIPVKLEHASPKQEVGRFKAEAQDSKTRGVNMIEQAKARKHQSNTLNLPSRSPSPPKIQNPIKSFNSQENVMKDEVKAEKKQVDPKNEFKFKSTESKLVDKVAQFEDKFRSIDKKASRQNIEANHNTSKPPLQPQHKAAIKQHNYFDFCPPKYEGNTMNIFSTFMEELQTNYSKRETPQASPKTSPVPSPKTDGFPEKNAFPKPMPKHEVPQARKNAPRHEQPRPKRQPEKEKISDMQTVPVITVVRPPPQSQPKQQLSIKVELEEKKHVPSQQNISKKEVVKINVEPPISREIFHPKRAQTPKSLRRVQKPHAYHSIELENNVNTIKQQEILPERNKSGSLSRGHRPKSLPKTERQKFIDFGITNYKQMTKYQKNNLLDEFLSNGGIRRDEPIDVFNKTLSYFAVSRKKVRAGCHQLEKFHSAGQMLERMKLDKHEIVFNARYFQPLTLEMNSLRGQALNLFGSGCSYAHFYFGRYIEARLIKEGDNQYLLSLHNIADEPLVIQHQDMKNAKFSRRIQIITWANKQVITPCTLPQNGYLDIKFHFKVYDLNFKFLTFQLIINKTLQSLVLPITLLDICQIGHSDMRHMQQFALKGSILTSHPFRLRAAGLPQFMGGYRFQDKSARIQQSAIIGQCSIQMDRIDRNETSMADLHAVVKLLDHSTRKVQLQLLYSTKDQQSMNLAKVMLYLLTFLLVG